ncbi:MAG: DUF1553 domain-containing protein [Pirellulaceae bacterium]|nr:DUF1553 domain-containing protein [Pirellulaceae bacterium]
MWARHLLFLGVCAAGVWLVGDQLLRRDRVADPRTARPDRFAGVEEARPWPDARQPSKDWAATLGRLNGEFRDHRAKHDLPAAPRADHLTIARRMSLALVGTVPSVEEIRALEAVRPDDRVEWWTSHLLEDRRFADYWAERFARMFCPPDINPPIIFRRNRFTTWLGDQFAANTPYNEVVQKLIAEQGVWTGNPAANFITATAQNDKQNQPDPVRLAGRTARAFLGMRIDCLQCHDDKLGNLSFGTGDSARGGTQADFHQLAAFFGSTQFGLVGVYDGNKMYEVQYLDADKEVVVPAKVPFLDELADGHGTRREQLARWVTHPENKAFARATVNRAWALLFGQPLVQPIDDIPLEGPYPPGLELLADDFIAHDFDLQRLIRLITASEVFQLDSRADFEITAEHEKQWAVFPLTRLRPEQMAGSLSQSAQLETIDGQAHVVMRIAKFQQIRQFVERYGDAGQDEFTDRAGTIPQRLLMMNGDLVKERTGGNFVASASARIAALTNKPEKQVEVAYLATLTRRPSEEELAHFTAQLAGLRGEERGEAMEDLYWTLINSTEFSWNH